ncbi:MAG: hypothetical protein GY746_08750 [Gammaproteobacteria bacterium]|nr:hypothetical protein [Gammaproteobacteria bacterium]
MKYAHIFLIGMMSSVTSTQTFASMYPGNNPSTGLGSFGVKDKAGVFCMVEKVKVCVIARDAEDCKRIGGEKVKTCNKSE